MKLKFNICGLSQPYHHYEEADFIFYENGWDDFNYRTVYTVYVKGEYINNKNWKYIGVICIFRVNQDTGKNILSNQLLDKGSLIEELPKDFVSVIRDEKLLNILFCILTPEQRKDFIQSLHLIVDEGNYLQMVKHDKCFNVSALRNITYGDFLTKLQYAQDIMYSEINGKAILNSYAERVLQNSQEDIFPDKR